MLEPVKAAFARRAEVRDRRLKTCVVLIEGATVNPAVTALNRMHRDEQADRPVNAQAQRQAVERLIVARQQIRESVVLLRLTGPEELCDSADSVREHERVLRRAMYAAHSGGAHPDELPEIIVSARAGLEDSLRVFADIARQKA